MLAYQGSLLGLSSTIDLEPLTSELERIPLAGGAWIDIRRAWIRGADLLFTRLFESVSWRAERRKMYDRTLDVPRLLAFFKDGVTLPDESLVAMRDALNDHYQFEPGGNLRTIGMCLYRDGRDSVAWHGDRFARSKREDAVVAIGSLGEPRALHLRPRGGGRAQRFVLGSGDLFVMGGSCQRTWEHCVPKTKRLIGPRMSMQFRPLGVG